MEVDSKNETIEGEALLLGDGGEEQETQEFSSGDVELLLGDDDVNAFANESYETNDDSSETGSEKKPQENKSQSREHVENHNRGRGGYRMRGPRGYGPPPGYFPRGLRLRPPFPGAVPRFGRHPPPFAFRGRPPMGYMRYPRGVFMQRHMRPHFAPHVEEEFEEDETMPESEKKEGESSEESGGGPKPLMSIRTPKDVRETVKTSILAKGPLLNAPLGMGMGPRFHLHGMRPPPGAPPLLPQPPPIPTPQPPQRAPGASRGGRGGHVHGQEHHQRSSLKRPASGSSTSFDHGPRPKMSMNVPPPSSATSGVSRTNLRQIQTVDEPMHQQHQPHYNHHQHHQQPQPHYRPRHPPPNSRGGFTVSHTPAPSLTQIRTVDSSYNVQPKPVQQQQNQQNSNLRSIPTIGSSVPSPMNNQQQPRITKTGGQSNRVMISNLPRNMSFERISAMTTACGNVRNINVNENGTAIVEFANTAGAENFIRANNRKIIDRSLITVSRLA